MGAPAWGMGGLRLRAPGPSTPPNKGGDTGRAAGGATWRARVAAAGPAGEPPAQLPGSAHGARADPHPLKGTRGPRLGGPVRGPQKGPGRAGRAARSRLSDLGPPPLSVADSQVLPHPRSLPSPRRLWVPLGVPRDERSRELRRVHSGAPRLCSGTAPHALPGKADGRRLGARPYLPRRGRF